MNDAGPVVVDTSAFYALVSASDRFHSAAARTYRNLLDTERDIWTTSYVLVEFGAITHRRLGFSALSTFRRGLAGTLKTVWVDRVRHEMAWSELEEAQGRGLSFVDWTVVLAARDLGAAVFAFDGDFRNSGVPVIPEVI